MVLDFSLKFFDVFAFLLNEIGFTKSCQIGNNTYTFPFCDRYIFKEMKSKGNYHKDRIDRAMKVLVSNDLIKGPILINIGAHVGTIAIPLLREGIFEKALLLEPSRSNFSCLVKNIDNFNLNIKVFLKKIAAGALEEDGKLSLSFSNSGDNTLVPHIAGGLARLRFKQKVKIQRLDNIMENASILPSQVGLIICDVQGFEKNVLLGSPLLLNHCPPLILEFDHRYCKSAQVSSIQEILSIKYSCFYDLENEELKKISIDNLVTYFYSFDGYRDILIL